MMFYTTVAGWMLYYFYQMLAGKFVGKDSAQVGAMFQDMLDSPGVLTVVMAIIVAAGILVCSMGLQKGVERITKIMMSLLLIIIIVLAIHSMTLDGGVEGLKFYLMPDFQRADIIVIPDCERVTLKGAFYI